MALMNPSSVIKHAMTTNSVVKMTSASPTTLNAMEKMIVVMAVMKVCIVRTAQKMDIVKERDGSIVIMEFVSMKRCYVTVRIIVEIFLMKISVVSKF